MGKFESGIKAKISYRFSTVCQLMCVARLIQILPFLILFSLGIPRIISLLVIQKRPSVYSIGIITSIKISLTILLGVSSLVYATKSLVSKQFHLIAPYLISVLGYLFAAVLHHVEHARSRVGSTSLLFFWLANIVSSGVLLLSSILQNNGQQDIYYFILSTVSFVGSILVFILEVIPPKSTYGYIQLDEDHDAAPEDNANIFSRLSFHWIVPLIKLGYVKELKMENLFNVPADMKAESIYNSFRTYWVNESSKQNPSILWVLARVFAPALVYMGVMNLLSDLLNLSQPQFLDLLMRFIESHSETNPSSQPIPLSHGLFIACSMLLVISMKAIFTNQYEYMTMKTSMQARTAIVTAVYRKSLKLSNSARQESTTGEITNLMQLDAENVSILFYIIHPIWSIPFQVVLITYLLYRILGVAVFCGLAVMVVTIPLNTLIGTRMSSLLPALMKNKDTRTGLIDEFLNSIKVVKLYAWEDPLLKRIFESREKELENLKGIGHVYSLFAFVWSSIPVC